MIVVCTPTRNRRWAWNWSRMCMDAQDQQPDLWIVVDNSDDPSQDWSVSQEHPNVQQHRVSEREPIGKLRNRCLDLALQAGADWIVFWDDDDQQVPQRISAGIRALEQNPKAQQSGCNVLQLLLTAENHLMKVGPYGDHHSTAATWTLRRSCIEHNRFKEDAVKGEEASFTRDWNIPMAIVAPEDSILVMGHSRNTVNKSQVGKDPRKFVASSLNSANGKMVARMKWFPTREVQDMWRRTFFDASNEPLPGTISGLPKEASVAPVNVPIEESVKCDGCHVSIPQLTS